MIACPSCGQENPDGFRLCGMCGAPLAVTQAPVREERKVVTVVFCDLVGFTARAERLDPEEVRRVLRPSHERVRVELERRGGTVEKFIGDAVMALFGAPTAHEDDPERAVRAALAIREFAFEEGLELRVGITTGEALVSLDARPDAGEGMASGDVVNTAARLQSAAPVNGFEDLQIAFRLARDIRDPQTLIPTLVRGASVYLLLDDYQEAEAAAGEALDRMPELPGRALWMLPLVAVDLEHQSVVRELLEPLRPSDGKTAAFAMLDGDFARAAEIYEAGGFALFAADARQRSARKLFESGHRAEGEAELGKALAFYRSIDASLLVRRAENLLATAG